MLMLANVVTGGKGCELGWLCTCWWCKLLLKCQVAYYEGEDYDLAGFAVGVVEHSKIIDGTKVKSGDVPYRGCIKWCAL